MSTLRNPTPISTTIRKKKEASKHYDPIYRIGENIVARIGGDDRLGNLFVGDTLLSSELEEVTGHINMVHHIVKIPVYNPPANATPTSTAAGIATAATDVFKALEPYSYSGALQVAQPKLNEMIQKNPSQNKETIPEQKTSFILTDVHVNDVKNGYAVGQLLYATPEKAPAEYSSLGNAFRFVLAKKSTFEDVLKGMGLNTAQIDNLAPKFAVGRAHNGKKAGYGNCYYTIRY